MPFGYTTVTIVLHSDADTPGELGTYAQVEIPVDAPGCHHRPLTFQETAELQFDVATELWKTTIPIGEYSPDLREQVVSARPDDTLKVNDIEYSIIGGVEPFDDFTAPFKATIYSKKHIG